MLLFTDNITNPCSHYYHKAEELPDRARAKIPPCFHDFMSLETASFFKPLADNLPETFEKLASTSKIAVLEWVIQRETGEGEQVIDYFYHWGFDLFTNKYLLIDIPLFAATNTLRKKLQNPMIQSLPSALKGIYENFDGLGISAGFGLKTFDFPQNFDYWQDINSYYSDVDLAPGDAFLPFQYHQNSRPQVIARMRNNDFLLVDVYSKSGQLYVIRYENPKEALPVSTQNLDQYFSLALETKDPKISIKSS